MSGKIEVKTRIGESHDPRYARYVEWYIEVKGEDGVKTTLSPKFPEMRKMLVDILVHEFRNDATRDRNPDFIKKQVLLNIADERIFEDAQMTFEDFEMPEVYIKTNRLLPGCVSKRRKLKKAEYVTNMLQNQTNKVEGEVNV